MLALALLALPAGASAQAPVNDNYLESLQLNAPGKKLERKSTLRDVRDTSAATVQGDVFSPPNSGGPAELTTCAGASYGKTVWYDFYPDVNGLVRLRASSAFDPVIAVVPFNRQSTAPRFDRSQCANESSSTSEEFLAEVRKGASYTVQIGGVNAGGGSLEFLFDFLADTDGDRVLDDTDNCPRLKGSGGRGCPLRLRADTTLRALPTAGGIKLDRLSVSLNRKSRVEVRCKGCRPQVKRGKKVGFPKLRGRELPAGSKLEIRATRKGAFGSYTAYKIVAGNFKKITRCMNPGSRKLRKKCG